MDHLEHAKTLYCKRYNHAGVLSSEDIVSLSSSIRKMIRTCLEQHRDVSSFKYYAFIDVIKRTVKSEKFQSDKTAMAFLVLENYFLLLIEQPWKREFWVLKRYGGYFCTKVKAYLECPEAILELVGYKQEEGSSDDRCLVLDHSPEPEITLNVSFDCLVASIKCEYIGEYYEKMKNFGLDLPGAVSVILPETSIDPVHSSQGKNLQAGSNCVSDKSSISRKSVSGVLPTARNEQMVMASGGMGMGIVRGASTMHQVTGVQPRQVGLLQPSLLSSSLKFQPTLVQPYRSALDPITGPLRVDLPALQNPVSVNNVPHMYHAPVLMEAVSRPTSVASQPAGSRASYGSSAYAPSSGYGSEAASVLGAPSSAYTASSGYNSGTPSQMPANNCTYLPDGHVARNRMDPSLTQSNRTIIQRHRHLPLAQANFPFIDEDEIGSSSPFPEATHEEHLKESLRNLQAARPDTKRSDHELTNSLQQIKQPLAANAVGVPVSYDNWEWFRNSHAAPPVYSNTAGPAEKAGQLPGVIQRHAYHTSDMRYADSQPSTAVTAMLNQGPMVTNSDGKQHISPIVSHHQKVQSVDYISATGNTSTVGPWSDSALSCHGPWANHSQISGDLLHDGSTSKTSGLSQSPLVYHPPIAENNVPFQRYITTVGDPQLQIKQAPFFAQMVVSGSAVNAALLSRQPQGSPTSNLNALDKGLQDKVLNIRQESSGSSSEVVMREKLGVSRASSLVTPQETVGSRGLILNRQTSRSMDMGLMKWKCQMCTVENSPLENICKVCSKSRNSPDLHYPPGESKVRCPSCTYENLPDHTTCEICNSPLLQNVHTYV